MKKAVMYGAGNIGRGFMGHLFYENQYETTFIDINKEVIAALNAERKYPIRIVSNEAQEECIIENVSGIDGGDAAAVADAIAECDIMSLAVGVNIIPKIIPNLAEGIRQRAAIGTELNIIICENKIGADSYIRGLVKEALPEELHEFIDSKVGFIEASVGRMVPVVTEEMKGDNLLRVWVEPFCMLPVDADAFKGEIPEFTGIVPEGRFEYFIQRKLFLHNMGHCLSAYLGNLHGYTYIYEAIRNEAVSSIVLGAMYASAKALSAEHGISLVDVMDHANDLIDRFGNRYLGDTIERVGRDLPRKLGENDRFFGIIKLCKKHGIDATYIKLGVAAAMLFGEDFDTKSLNMEDLK